MSPINIVIDIIKEHLRKACRENHNNEPYLHGKIKGFEELLDQFEGLKKLIC